jgi:hypothetical protein
MNELDVLEKNPFELKKILKPVLSETELAKIIAFSYKHCRLLMQLSKNHLYFARSISSSHAWRQKTSRSYYCCYNASKALRLAINGEYSQEGADHKRIGELPGKFPKRNYWSNLLTEFRSDRNIADYDHDKSCKDLKHSPRKYLEYSETFYKEAYSYLKNRGII